jgi:hypothetical protein
LFGIVYVNDFKIVDFLMGLGKKGGMMENQDIGMEC